MTGGSVPVVHVQFNALDVGVGESLGEQRLQHRQPQALAARVWRQGYASQADDAVAAVEQQLAMADDLAIQASAPEQAQRRLPAAFREVFMHLLEAQRMPQGGAGPLHQLLFRGEPALQGGEVFQLERDELQVRDGTRAGCGHAECLAQVIGGAGV